MDRRGSGASRSRRSSPRADRDYDWAVAYGQPENPRSVDKAIEELCSPVKRPARRKTKSDEQKKQDRSETLSYDDTDEWLHNDLDSTSQDIPTDCDDNAEDPKNFCDGTLAAEIQLKKRKSLTRTKKPSPPLLREQPRQTFECHRFQQGFDWRLSVILVVLLAIVAYLLVLRPTARPDLWPTFSKKLTDLQKQFPAQPKASWSIIRAAFSEVLNGTLPDKQSLAVLVVVAALKDQDFASCFIDKLSYALAHTYSSSEEPIQLSGKELSFLTDSGVAKHRIDDIVRQRGDNFVLSFKHLEQIDPDTALIFHSFCDYYNSPFHERAIFIFSVHTTESLEGVYRREIDSMAERVLNKAWDRLDVDKRSALIARLTGHTILYHKESRRRC